MYTDKINCSLITRLNTKGHDVFYFSDFDVIRHATFCVYADENVIYGCNEKLKK